MNGLDSPPSIPAYYDFTGLVRLGEFALLTRSGRDDGGPGGPTS